MADPTQKKYPAQKRLPLTEALHDQLNATGNASRYLREAAQTRLRRYQEARALLSEAGWTKDEIRAVCDVLNGTALAYGIDKGEQIAASMEDAARLDATHEKWDISEGRWHELAQSVRDREPTARAVWDVLREVWGPSGHVDL